MWDNPDEPGPTRYLHEHAILGGWSKLYLASTTAFPRLNDPTLPQEPKIYRHFHSLHAMVTRLRKECDEYNQSSGKLPIHVGCMLWEHPEAHYQPLPEFQQIKNKFPGCICQ